MPFAKLALEFFFRLSVMDLTYSEESIDPLPCLKTLRFQMARAFLLVPEFNRHPSQCRNGGKL